jgi:hypothetical protein
MRIKIVQCADSEPTFARVIKNINTMYAEKHDYIYIYIYNHVFSTDNFIQWYKVDTILHNINDCDFLLYLDWDAFVYSHELTLEFDLIIKWMMDVDCLIAADSGCEHKKWYDGTNTGVMLFRNSQKTIEILNRWWALRYVVVPNWEFFKDQSVFNAYILKEYKDNIRILDDYYIMNGQYGQFIRHYAGFKNSDREWELKEICKCRKEFNHLLPLFDNV